MAERMLFLEKLKKAASENKEKEQEGTNIHKSSLPLYASCSCDDNIENDINYNNTPGNNSEESKLVSRQRSLSTSSSSSSSSSSSTSCSSSTAVESNLQIETEPKAIELTNMNAESEEDKKEKDFSSDDSIADPHYHIENNDLSTILRRVVK